MSQPATDNDCAETDLSHLLFRELDGLLQFSLFPGTLQQKCCRKFPRLKDLRLFGAFQFGMPRWVSKVDSSIATAIIAEQGQSSRSGIKSVISVNEVKVRVYLLNLAVGNSRATISREPWTILGVYLAVNRCSLSDERIVRKLCQGDLAFIQLHIIQLASLRFIGAWSREKSAPLAHHPRIW